MTTSDTSPDASLRTRLVNYWESLEPEKRTKIKFISAIIGAFLFMFFLYYLKGGAGERPQPPDRVTAKPVDQSTLLSSDIRAAAEETSRELSTKVSEQESKLLAIQTMLEEMNTSSKSDVGADPQASTSEPTVSTSEATSGQVGRVSVDPWADIDESAYRAPPPPPSSLQNAQPGQQSGVQLLGGIGQASIEQVAARETTSEKKSVFLPPSFFEATLLTGIDAPVEGGGESNPRVIVFRVNTPAILPNEVKANLKGCFVVANAWGNLATERVETQLVSLECLGLEGQAVISSSVKGFVTDADGKRDMAGQVVSRASTNFARAALAGMIEGGADAYSESATTTFSSGFGVTQGTDGDKVGRAALGEGLSSGASEIRRYLMELVRQTVPAVEVGAAKNVTIFIQEGVNIEIKGLKS